MANTPLTSRHVFAILMASCLISACTPSAQTELADADLAGLEAVDPSVEAELVIWRDLMPDEELDALRALNEGEADPSLMGQFIGNSPIENQSGTFNVVEDLDGVVARMPGYILPLDFAEHGQAREFLLLPFHGACVHYPPPPPNQIVYLRSIEPVRFASLWEPVWVEGRIHIERVDTDLAASAYSMVLRSVTPYEP